MKQIYRRVIQIVEECHGAIAIAPNYKKAIEYLINTGWFTEFDDVYIEGEGVFPVTEVYGENWQEKVTIADLDMRFSFSEIDFAEEVTKVFTHEYSPKRFETFEECAEDFLTVLDGEDIAQYSNLTVGDIIDTFLRHGNSDDFSAWFQSKIDEAIQYAANDLIIEKEEEEEGD